MTFTSWLFICSKHWEIWRTAADALCAAAPPPPHHTHAGYRGGMCPGRWNLSCPAVLIPLGYASASEWLAFRYCLSFKGFDWTWSDGLIESNDYHLITIIQGELCVAELNWHCLSTDLSVRHRDLWGEFRLGRRRIKNLGFPSVRWWRMSPNALTHTHLYGMFLLRKCWSSWTIFRSD